METGASLILRTDADALALARAVEIEVVPTEHPLAAAPGYRYASQWERDDKEPREPCA